jgi:TonB family protein
MPFVVVTISMTLMAGCSGAKPDDCGFSKFKPLEIAPGSITGESPWWDSRTHWAPTPFYPPEARAKGLSGTVHLRVLIDADGRLVNTCPVRNPGEVVPNQILVDAAKNLAHKARFRPNFGVGTATRPSARYAQTTIDVNFRLSSDSTK